jgi:transposase
MIKGQFLTALERQHLLVLVRRPSGQHGPARRAHAILLLDDGLAVPEVARVLYIDDDTVYQWHQRWTSGGVGHLTDFGWKGSLSRLSTPQEVELVKALMGRVFTSTSEIIALVEKRFSIPYSRSGMIKLLARLGFEYKKPKALPRLPTVQAQQAFVAEYSRLLSRLEANDQVVFLDAVYPEYQSRPAHGWIKKGDRVAILRMAGRQRLNLHGALNLESGLCQIVEGETVNTETTIRLFSRLLSAYPGAGKSMFSSTMPDTTMPRRLRHGWSSTDKGSISGSCRPTRPISTRSSDYGASCTRRSLTTNTMKALPISQRR